MGLQRSVYVPEISSDKVTRVYFSAVVTVSISTIQFSPASHNSIAFKAFDLRALLSSQKITTFIHRLRAKSESNNKLDKRLRRAYSKVDDQIHARSVCLGRGKAMAEANA